MGSIQSKTRTSRAANDTRAVARMEPTQETSPEYGVVASTTKPREDRILRLMVRLASDVI